METYNNYLKKQKNNKTTAEWNFSFKLRKAHLLYVRVWGKDYYNECHVPLIYLLGFSLLLLNYTKKSLFRTASKKWSSN